MAEVAEMAEMGGRMIRQAFGGAGAGWERATREGTREGELSLAVCGRLLVERTLRLPSAGGAMRGDQASSAEDSDALAKSENDAKGSKNPRIQEPEGHEFDQGRRRRPGF